MENESSKTAHTLGIIAVIMGAMALLVAWVPFVGMVAIPVAIIGFSLSAIGLIVSAFKGFKGAMMPAIGGGLCIMSFFLVIVSTGGTAKAIEDASIEQIMQHEDSDSVTH